MSLETIKHSQRVVARKDHKCNYCNQKITKGSPYYSSVHKYDGDVYTWKSHDQCSQICLKLKMQDYADEGVTQEHFCESIREEYRTIMSDTQNELYESKEFKIPPFADQLQFVLTHHKIIP